MNKIWTDQDEQRLNSSESTYNKLATQKQEIHAARNDTLFNLLKNMGVEEGAACTVLKAVIERPRDFADAIKPFDSRTWHRGYP